MGILDKLGFGKLKEGLAKTREGLIGTVTRILTGAPRIDDALLEQLEESLIAADVGSGTASEIMKGLRRRLKETPPSDAGGVLPLLQDEVSAQLAGSGPVTGHGDLYRSTPNPNRSANGRRVLNAAVLP